MSDKSFYLMLMVLCLWLAAWRCQRCSAQPVVDVLLERIRSDNWSYYVTEKERNALKQLLERKDKCTLDFFAEFERLTEGTTGNYDSDERKRNDQMKESVFSECKGLFYGDFAHKVSLLTALERRLVRLDHVLKTTHAFASMLDKFRRRQGGGLKIYAIMSVMGDAGAFAGGVRLSEKEFNAKYVELIEQPCASLRQKLEPAAELFRMYSEDGRHMFDGFDGTWFTLAATSKVCKELTERPGFPTDYEAYTILLEDHYLPGDPASGVSKASFHGQLDEVLGTKDHSVGCSSKFFAKFDQVIIDADQFGMKQTEQAELEYLRGLWWTECKDEFVKALEASINALDPVVAAAVTKLGNTFYGNRNVADRMSVMQLGDRTLAFLKEADPRIQTKQLDEDQFAQVYRRLIVEPCKLLNSKLEPAVDILGKYAYAVSRQYVNYRNTGKYLMDWIGRSTLCRSTERYLAFAQESYKQMIVTPPTETKAQKEKKPSIFRRMFRKKP